MLPARASLFQHGPLAFDSLQEFLSASPYTQATWWEIRQSALARDLTPEQEQKALEKDLSALAASVEYGLREYQGKEGVCSLAQELERVYGQGNDYIKRQ